MTTTQLKTALDAVLKQNVERHGGSPGVVAMATNRQENFYEGAAGSRELGKDGFGSLGDAVGQTAVLQWLGKCLSIAKHPGNDVIHGYSAFPRAAIVRLIVVAHQPCQTDDRIRSCPRSVQQSALEVGGQV